MYGGLVDHLLWTREAERALTVADQGLQVLPDSNYLKGRKVYALLNLGRTDDARATLQGLPGGKMPTGGDQLLVDFWFEAWSEAAGTRHSAVQGRRHSSNAADFSFGRRGC